MLNVSIENNLPDGPEDLSSDAAVTQATDLFEEKKPDLKKITSSIMLKTSLTNIKDDGKFQLGFARKEIVNIGVTLTHSSVAFLDLNAKTKKKWLIFGRQTAFFLKPGVKASTQQKSARGMIGLFDDLTVSKIDNEKNYDFFRSSTFEAEMTDVILTGAEVKKIIAEVNQRICNNHRFTLVISNCYSASISMLACAIETISQREETSEKETLQNSKAILAIKNLLMEASQDNFSFGVKNQELVMEYIKEINSILKTRGLSPIYEHNNFLQKTINKVSEALEDGIETIVPIKMNHRPKPLLLKA